MSFDQMSFIPGDHYYFPDSRLNKSFDRPVDKRLPSERKKRFYRKNWRQSFTLSGSDDQTFQLCFFFQRSILM